jgi:long-chain acyl-CoA synthetase
MSFNLATILAETALAAPDAPVNIFSDVTTTYRELDEQSSLLAAGLSEIGLRPGQVIALQLRPRSSLRASVRLPKGDRSS